MKEAAEEAAIPAALASQARRVATISYAMERPEGLRRDLLYCYDLTLPEDFVARRPPTARSRASNSGRSSGCSQTVRDTDDFKFNVNLVLIDLFERLHLSALR